MNFLAHLYLADPTPEALMGSLLGDFVKGQPDERFGAEVIAGIRLHRAIDHFTDHHPQVLASKRLISPLRRRFAGIIVDVVYDYCLCRHWSRFSDVELPEFISTTYCALEQYQGYLPERAAIAVQALIAEDWLSCYGTLGGIGHTLNRISRRIKRTNALAGAIEELEVHEAALGEHFLDFFPALVAFVNERSPASGTPLWHQPSPPRSPS